MNKPEIVVIMQEMYKQGLQEGIKYGYNIDKIDNELRDKDLNFRWNETTPVKIIENGLKDLKITEVEMEEEFDEIVFNNFIYIY